MDRTDVQLSELLRDASVIADSHTNLHGYVLLYDDIPKIADIAEISEAEPMMMMPMMPVTSSTHGVEFRIDQLAHSTHEFPPQGLQ
ncbi:hypothetical protein [Bradyrhizobium sp. DASA03120]|uniref:hypothetical protein n=1 Tax=Bradyrhizobium sp. SMVTL-02 TaxID=3395917 RepID=UPI003F6E5E32